MLFSGGTDSTCAAALMVERFERVHLLTFEELGTSASASPAANVERLRRRYGAERFVHREFPVDRLLREVSYRRYAHYLRRHGLFMVSNCGFSSLSWHLRTLAYCLDNGVTAAADGLTREMLHLPGHMDPVLALFRRLYARFGIEYANPVRDWDVPPAQQMTHRLIVDLHGAPPPSDGGRTTGRYLYEAGVLPAPNVKGTPLDRGMQRQCYPLVLFHVFAFWYFLPFHTMAEFETRLAALFSEKIEEFGGLLEEYRADRANSAFARWLR